MASDKGTGMANPKEMLLKEPYTHQEGVARVQKSSGWKRCSTSQMVRSGSPGTTSERIARSVRTSLGHHQQVCCCAQPWEQHVPASVQGFRPSNCPSRAKLPSHAIRKSMNLLENRKISECSLLHSVL